MKTPILSSDLRGAYPEMGGLSPRNLLFMRAFAAAYPEPQVVKQAVSLLPWGHIVRLLQRIKEPDIRLAELNQRAADRVVRIQENFEDMTQCVFHESIWNRSRLKLVTHW